jgi:hypothetical protein
MPERSRRSGLCPTSADLRVAQVGPLAWYFGRAPHVIGTAVRDPNRNIGGLFLAGMQITPPI